MRLKLDENLDNAGIAVIRLPRRCAKTHLEDAVAALIEGLTRTRLEGKLWIVQPGLIREYQDDPAGS